MTERNTGKYTGALAGFLSLTAMTLTLLDGKIDQAFAWFGSASGWLINAWTYGERHE